MGALQRFALSVVAAALYGSPGAAQAPDRRQLERSEQALRQEGQAVVALADAAAAGQSVPADFVLTWHNDFLKAQTGTFVPFVVGVAAKEGRMPAVLLYVRAARRQPADDRRGGRRRPTAEEVALHPFEEIYPVAPAADGGQPTRISRGFALDPGEYELTVVVREREAERSRKKTAAAVLGRPLVVPDFSTGELTTSTIMLADRLDVLTGAAPEPDLQRRPYVIGNREVQPATDAVFRRAEELIVVFLVYNPTIREGKHFDLEVEYHFFRSSPTTVEEPRPVPAGVLALPGERYFNRTEPQRFNPAVLGPAFDPGSGQPVMAGQGVPLAGFEAGEYRLAIRVTDLVAGRSIERHVRFEVRS